jgi:hypothetical protein
MSDWPAWTALAVSVGVFVRGEYLRAQSNAASRGALVDDVVSVYDTSDLFKADLPDYDARGLASSANGWKEKCRLAQLSVQRLSSMYHDLAVCISAVTNFRDEVKSKILSKEPVRSENHEFYVYGKEREDLRELISDLLEEVSAPVQRLRAPRSRRFRQS